MEWLTCAYNSNLCSLAEAFPPRFPQESPYTGPSVPPLWTLEVAFLGLGKGLQNLPHWVSVGMQ